jgi:hypothetical protein
VSPRKKKSDEPEEPDTQVVEPVADPVAEAVEPAPEPVAVEPEPEPVAAAPEPEPEPVAFEPEPEPAPAWEAGLSGSGEALAERPEILAGAAFAGGLAFALILKRLGR